MAPPDTNLEKQKRRHRPVLIWLAIAISVFLIAALMFPSTEIGPEFDNDATPEKVND